LCVKACPEHAITLSRNATFMSPPAR
jgi:ferredoxin